MKTQFYLLTALAVVTAVFSAAPARPQFQGDPSAAKADFEKHGSERHKWKKGEGLPESLAEAGLLFEATLVWSGLYLDGGTKGYLFKDIAGKFLAICTGPGLQSKDHPRRIDAAVGSRFFIGGLHYTKEGVELVPTGSKTEAWLRKLIDEKLNEAPEPTPGAVTPRATEGASK